MATMTAAGSLLGLVVVAPFLALCTVLLVVEPSPATVVGFAIQVGAVAFYSHHYLEATWRRDREALRRELEPLRRELRRSIDEPGPRP
jgi:hypothetical protein